LLGAKGWVTCAKGDSSVNRRIRNERVVRVDAVWIRGQPITDAKQKQKSQELTHTPGRNGETGWAFYMGGPVGGGYCKIMTRT